jgi:NAD(P)-dependent dehydrogenase (short-subunit alcohol dehydrogenase family)
MFTSTLLKDRVAVVTGGGTGLGLAIAQRLSELGALVAIGSRDADHLERGTAELRHAGFDPQAIQLDVRKPEQVDEMVTRVVRHFGRIDILINNAGGNFVCKAEDLSPNGWNAVVGIGTPHDRQGRRWVDRVDPGQLRLDGQPRHRPLGSGEGRGDVHDADARRRVGAAQDPGQCRGARRHRIARGRPTALERARRRGAHH